MTVTDIRAVIDMTTQTATEIGAVITTRSGIETMTTRVGIDITKRTGGGIVEVRAPHVEAGAGRLIRRVAAIIRIETGTAPVIDITDTDQPHSCQSSSDCCCMHCREGAARA